MRNSANPLPHIEALIDAGGQIMIGTVQPIVDSAVAHDGKLLSRLDKAIQTAHETGRRVDEINEPDSEVRYRYKTRLQSRRPLVDAFP
jgi:hypothetical protein